MVCWQPASTFMIVFTLHVTQLYASATAALLSVYFWPEKPPCLHECLSLQLRHSTLGNPCALPMLQYHQLQCCLSWPWHKSLLRHCGSSRCHLADLTSESLTVDRVVDWGAALSRAPMLLNASPDSSLPSYTLAFVLLSCQVDFASERVHPAAGHLVVWGIL